MTVFFFPFLNVSNHWVRRVSNCARRKCIALDKSQSEANLRYVAICIMRYAFFSLVSCNSTFVLRQWFIWHSYPININRNIFVVGGVVVFVGCYASKKFMIRSQITTPLLWILIRETPMLCILHNSKWANMLQYRRHTLLKKTQGWNKNVRSKMLGTWGLWATIEINWRNANKRLIHMKHMKEMSLALLYRSRLCLCMMYPSHFKVFNRISTFVQFI